MSNIARTIKIRKSCASPIPRSQRNLINCDISLDNDEEYAIHATVIDAIFASKTQRLADLNITFDGSLTSLKRMVANLRDVSAPCLKILRLYTKERRNWPYSDPTFTRHISSLTNYPFANAIFSKGFPQQLRLYICGDVGDLWPPVETVTLLNLSTQNQFLSWQGFTSIISIMSSLNTLIIGGDMLVFETMDLTQRIKLSLLSSLSIWGCYNRYPEQINEGQIPRAGYFVEFLTVVEMPALRSLHISHTIDELEQLSTFCKSQIPARTFPLLQELRINDASPVASEEYMKPIYRACPLLRID
ncbi:hypothetical protein HWV62_8036 [Athelia sp. TMB]|nr:hypothetical protein HWV62_8036 [Athelia sp. TMB]